MLCDVVPMFVAHMLLGRPWQYDRKSNHDGFKNKYSLTMDGRRYTLGPLTPMEIFEDQQRIKQQYEELSLGRKTLERKEKGKVSEPKQQSLELDQNGKSKGRENKEGFKEKKMSAYASMRDAREAISLNQPLLVLLCKEVFIISNEITNGFPNIVVDLLQVYEDLF